MRAMPSRTSGFTLMEGLIVVAIASLLAAVAIPQFASNKEEGRTDSMVESLGSLRGAIDKYWTQHDGFPGPTAADFEAQLLGRTNRQGALGAGEAFAFGPYLLGAIPENPVNQLSSVTVVDTMPNTPDGSSAWIYCNVTGEVRSNVPGGTLDGVAWFDL
jgi:prepilin-type N-terminal cleavage/methylation domain-containing protein